MTVHDRPRTPPLWAHLLLYALASLWLAFSGLYAEYNSDGFASSLTSRYAWTPFFWHQDRVGMLVPLITSIFTDPMANLILQTGITVFAGLCLPLLLAEALFPSPTGRLAALLANIGMIAFAHVVIANNFLIECYYPLAMVLGCSGLVALGRGPGWPAWWRVLLGCVFFGLACWVYIGVPLWLGPLALIRAWIQPGELGPGWSWRALLRPLLHARSAIGLVLIVAAFAVNYHFMLETQRALPWIFPTPSDGLPKDKWVESWREFADHPHRLPGTNAWEKFALAAAAVGVGLSLLLRLRPRYPILAASVVLLIPAAVEFLFIGTREWPATNDHHPRYILATIATVNLLLALVAVLPLSQANSRTRWLTFGIAAIALFGLIEGRHGLPALARPRQEIDKRAGRWTEPLLATDVDAIGGDYWTTFPTVFHANMVLRERNEQRFVYAVTLRGRVLLEQWDWHARPTMRVAVPRDPREHVGFLVGIQLCGLAPPEKIGESGPFDIYLVRPLVPYR